MKVLLLLALGTLPGSAAGTARRAPAEGGPAFSPAALLRAFDMELSHPWAVPALGLPAPGAEAAAPLPEAAAVAAFLDRLRAAEAPKARAMPIPVFPAAAGAEGGGPALLPALEAAREALGGLSAAQVAEMPAADFEGLLRRVWDGGRRRAAEAPAEAHVRGDNRLIFAAALSPEGSRAATAGADGIIRVWSLADGREVGELPDDVDAGGPMLALAFDPRGRTLAAGKEDGSIHLWDLASGGPARVLAGHPSRTLNVRALAFSPDGTMLASAAEDGQLKLWEPGSGRELARSKQLLPLLAAAFRPDGRAVATVDKIGTLRLHAVPGARVFWEARFRPEKEDHAPRAFEDAVYAAAFSPNGRWLAASGPKGRVVRLWNTRRLGRPPRVFAPQGRSDYVKQIAFNVDGTLMAVADENGIVRVWETRRGRLVLEDRAPDSVFAIRFDPSGWGLLVFDRDGDIRRIPL